MTLERRTTPGSSHFRSRAKSLTTDSADSFTSSRANRAHACGLLQAAYTHVAGMVAAAQATPFQASFSQSTLLVLSQPEDAYVFRCCFYEGGEHDGGFEGRPPPGALDDIQLIFTISDPIYTLCMCSDAASSVHAGGGHDGGGAGRPHPGAHCPMCLSFTLLTTRSLA